MLRPSTGCRSTPSTTVGRGRRAASNGWCDVDDVVELRAIPTRSSIPRGQCTIVPSRTPPQWDVTCFVHMQGVSRACAKPTA